LGSWPTVPRVPRFFERTRDAAGTCCGDECLIRLIRLILIDAAECDVSQRSATERDTAEFDNRGIHGSGAPAIRSPRPSQ